MQNQILVRWVYCFGKTGRFLAALTCLACFAGGAGLTVAQAATLTVTGLAVYDKTYDNLTTAALNTNGVVLVGVTNGDVVYLDVAGSTANFSSSQVGTSLPVTVNSLALAGAQSANYSIASLPTGLQASITNRPLGITVTASGKTYDRTTNASVTLHFENIEASDAGSVIAGYDTAGFGSKNVGLQTVTVSGLFIVGAAANNYVLTNAGESASTTATISPKTLRVAATGGTTNYNGTVTAPVTLFDNHYSGDSVTVTNDAAVFADPNVGNGKPVSVTGIGISAGGDGGNYTLNGITTASAQGNILPAALTVTVSGGDKTYDGTTNATVTLTPNPLGSDSVSASYSSAGYTSKAVGTGKTVTAYGIALTGPDAGNYTVAATASAAPTNTISPRNLTVVANTGADKTYDGTPSAIVGTTVTLADNRVTGDSLTIVTTGASFADKNVGNGKTVTVSGISITGGADAANYSAPNATATAPANIVKASLSITATGGSKAYDGDVNTTVTLADNHKLSDVLTESFGSAYFDTPAVGTGKTVHVTGLQVTGTDAGNYTLSSTTTTSTANITGQLLVVTATGVNKTYDGGTNATVTLADNRVSGDSFTVTYSAYFDDKNAATGKNVTVTNIALSGASAANYELANIGTNTTANITTRALTVTATGTNKPYDGFTLATVGLSYTPLAGDFVTVTNAAANFSDPFVGTGKPVTVIGLGISGGADAANYHVAGATVTTHADIIARTLSVTATGQNKAYDGTTNATVTLGDDRIGGDDLSVSYSSASFSDKSAGTNKTVTAYGLVLTGPQADSYVLAGTSVATTANISSRSLTVVATGVNKAYDGTTNATVTLADTRLAGDNFTNVYVSASFNNKNVGSGKTVTVTGISATGPDAVNYSLANTNATTQASITNRALAVTATGVNKVYDGTTNATVVLHDDRVAGDNLTDSYTSASFADKDVGVAKPVSVAGIQVTGDDAGNYTLSSTTTSTNADITGRTLTVAATGVDKLYDGTTNATVTLSDNHLAGDVVSATNTAAAFADKRVGSGKTVTVTGLGLTGANAGNYTLAGTTASTTAAITALHLTVTATGVDKVYDGNVNATVSLSVSPAPVPGDVLTTNYGSAQFAGSSVGAHSVAVAGIFIAGTDAANYLLDNTTASTTANITAGAATIAVTSSANPAGFHDAVTFTATLPADATGTVAFSTNGVNFSSGSLNGGVFTSSSLTNFLRGTTIVTATYGGDGNYSATNKTLAQVTTNHPPVTGVFTLSVTNGAALKMTLAGLLAAVSDADGDPVSLAGIEVSTNGITLATNATLLVYHNTNYLNDRFSYSVYDGYGYSTGFVSVASVVVPFLSANTGTIVPSAGVNHVSFHGVPGFTYITQRSLFLSDWKDISTNAAAADGSVQITDSFSDLGSAPGSAYYRLKWQPGVSAN